MGLAATRAYDLEILFRQFVHERGEGLVTVRAYQISAVVAHAAILNRLPRYPRCRQRISKESAKNQQRISKESAKNQANPPMSSRSHTVNWHNLG
jgi:hypothetical protein